jgi:uncharacterized protein (DUF302 family)
MNQDVYFVRPSDKAFDQAARDLEAAVKENGFGVLHVHDLGNTLRTKGFPFEEQCKVFEVCNPQQASKVLASDMQLNMALPCRISVFTEKGETRVGMIRPQLMLSFISEDSSIAEVAREVEVKTIQMIETCV